MTLSAADRCDRCAAQAYVKVAKDGTELLFCAHHSREHLDAVKAQGFVIITDDTPALSVS